MLFLFAVHVDLHNCFYIQNGESNAITALSDVCLIKDQGAILRDKVCKHASENSTIRTVDLLGCCIRLRENELPLVLIGQGNLLLVQVIIFDVLKDSSQILLPIATEGIESLNSLFLHKGHHTKPMVAILVNGKEYLVQLENILPWKTVEEHW
jgi:hypothetical protein